MVDCSGCEANPKIFAYTNNHYAGHGPATVKFSMVFGARSDRIRFLASARTQKITRANEGRTTSYLARRLED